MINNTDLAHALIKLLADVNEAGGVEGNTIDHAYSRPDSVLGKLEEALSIVCPEAVEAYFKEGNRHDALSLCKPNWVLVREAKKLGGQ
tara:strand:+ start:596 stop:859 length:264 start_codon:yes stop_codon:yes gene_type:complete